MMRKKVALLTFNRVPVTVLTGTVSLFLWSQSVIVSAGVGDPSTGSDRAAKKPSVKLTVLFFHWDNVFKGRMEPQIDPARVSEEGKKTIAGLEKSWNRRFQTNGHGMKMYLAPHGIRLAIEKARKEFMNLKEDRPWEQRIELAGISLLQEGDRLRAWYQAILPEQKQDYGFQQERAVETGGEAICYAESKDGFKWDKPNLGVCSFNGSKSNNIVSFASFIGSVFRDDHGLPQERYKSFEFGKLPPDELAKSPGGNFNTYCLYGLVSSDGYHWRSLTNNPLVRHFCDTQNVAVWDPLLKKYVGYFRDHQGGRAISRSETDNFHSWPHPVPILVPSPEDDPDIDYYSNGFTTYPGDPSLRLLFPAIYHEATDHVDVRLALSKEGRAFSWVSHQPIIELGKPGEWDSSQIYACPEMVRLPDGRLGMVFGGSDQTHNEAFFFGFYTNYTSRSSLAWATWDDGRLAGIQTDSHGEFFTHPFRMEGDDIQINARTEPGGTIQFELLQDSEPVKDFSLADNTSFEGDHVWTPIRWKSQPDISELKGKKLQLHVVLNKAKIFGYRITARKL